MPNVIPPDENSLNDALKVLDAAYHDGISYRKRALKELDDYVSGKYIDADGSRIITPKLTSMYTVWFRTVVSLLSYAVVPRRLRHDFMSSETATNLDTVLLLNNSPQGQEVVQQAYDKSLEALSIVLDDLRKVKMRARKTISLKKSGGNLYLHIEPDNRDIKLHEFKHNSPLENMFDYICSHTDEIITARQIDFGSQGYSKERDIPEDIRAAGISASLKKLLFPKCTSNAVMLIGRIEIEQGELDALLTGAKPDFIDN